MPLEEVTRQYSPDRSFFRIRRHSSLLVLRYTAVHVMHLLLGLIRPTVVEAILDELRVCLLE